jgi:hypothetical protein
LNSIKGELQVDVQNLLENDYKQKVIDILKSNDDGRNKYMNIRKAIADSKATDFTDLYTIMYEKVDEYAPNNTANVILTLAEGQYRCAMSVDKEIPTVAAIIEIINLLK